jgi:uncharacterized membrane protein
MEDNFKLGRAISQSRRPMPNANFEDMVMMGIEAELEKRRDRKYVVYASFCLAGFLVAGVVAFFTFNWWLPVLIGTSTQTVKLIFELVFVFCLVMQSERVLQYWNKYKVLAGS